MREKGMGMRRFIWLGAAALMLAACGDAEDGAAPETELPDPTVSAAPERAPEPPAAEAASPAPGQRAALIRACLGVGGNTEAACECAADEGAARLDPPSYDYFVAELSGSEEADALRGELSFTQMIATVEAVAEIGGTCELALPEL